MRGDKQAGAIWRAYAQAFEGRRQLYWSNGLKKLLAESDPYDDDLYGDSYDQDDPAMDDPAMGDPGGADPAKLGL